MTANGSGRPKAWFESEPNPASTGRFLLFSYHFPPSTRIGALRWQEFARHFAEAGWSLDVVMCRPEPGSGPSDEGLLADLPPGVRLFDVPHPEHPLHRLENGLLDLLRKRRHTDESGPSGLDVQNDDGPEDASPPRPAVARDDIRWGLTHPRGWMRIYWSWLWRERKLVWARRARRVGHRLATSEEYAAVICSGPPHVSHLAAGAVAATVGRPFVMDMRDPWSHAAYYSDWYASPVTLWYARRDEARSVGMADLVVTNTEAFEAVMKERHPEAAERIVTVRNGFDAPARVPQPPLERGRFSVRYAGSIYSARDPRPLFEGAARVVRDLGLTSEQFGVDLIGSFDDGGVLALRQLAGEVGMREFVSIGSWLPRQEAERFMAAGHVLVALPGHNKLGIPAKIYEYMRYPAWIMALADEGSATSRLLAGTEAEVVPTKDADAVAAALKRLYERHGRCGRPEPLARHPRFGRKAQAMKLLQTIEGVLSRDGVRGAVEHAEGTERVLRAAG